MVELQNRSGGVFGAGGYAKPLYGHVTIGGTEYRLVIGGTRPQQQGSSSSDYTVPTNVSYRTDIYNKAGQCDVTVLADSQPPEDVEMRVSIRDTTLFVGTVRNVQHGVGRRYRVTGFDVIADLKRTEVERDYDQQKVQTIAILAVSAAGGVSSIPQFGVRASPHFKGVGADKVLEKCAKWANAAWWVTEDNRVQMVAEDDIASERTEHRLEHVRDASPGKRTPAYQKVRVFGSSAVSRRGRKFRYVTSSEPVIATAGSGTPVFNYRDSNIQTQKMAENVAKKLKNRLTRQQKGGFVEVIGQPQIRPFDSVVMPQTYGGDKYLVSEATHTIDVNDGYVTRLTLGGLVSSGVSGGD